MSIVRNVIPVVPFGDFFHSFVHCVGIVFRHPTFVRFQRFYPGSKRMSITPDFIRILFVECASRQARVSLSSFPRD